jgi:hypothetical protein
MRGDAMPLDVIGAGLGRTGTLSLKAALEELGFGRCYHMMEVIAHPEHVPVWNAAGRGEPVDWEALFRGYRAAVDWPACNFYEELMRVYPAAKVILTVRDPDRWYESARQTIYQVRRVFPGWALTLLPRMRRLLGMIDRLIWDGFFQGRFEDRAHAIAAFNRHNQEVKRAVPEGRLLVFEVKEGWGPLCAFLGVPVPEGKPFPHLNDTEEFRAHNRRASRAVRAIALALAGAAAVVLALLALVVLRL